MKKMRERQIKRNVIAKNYEKREKDTKWQKESERKKEKIEKIIKKKEWEGREKDKYSIE